VAASGWPSRRREGPRADGTSRSGRTYGAPAIASTTAAVDGPPAIRRPRRHEQRAREPLAGTGRAARALSPAVAFRRGLASDLLNVKAGLFWTALVPQFLTTGGTLLPAAMVTGMVALVFAWLTGYAHLAARLAETLRSRRAARAVNGAVGTVLLALGGALALARR
jgi:threonine/homoserine/homoserine lactone efflux protein